jgi:hypothetical protein
MTFVKGQPKIAGRKPGTPNKVAANIKEICQRAAPQLIAELLRLAQRSKSEMVRIAAAKEILDRGFGKARQTVEGAVLHGVSLELQKLLAQHDGESRSIPTRTNGVLIEHDEDGNDHNNNGSDGLH